MKVTATLVKGKELKAGDLFSAVGQDYWDTINKNPLILGEKVYIRTDTVLNEQTANETVYRITIEK